MASTNPRTADGCLTGCGTMFGLWFPFLLLFCLFFGIYVGYLPSIRPTLGSLFRVEPLELCNLFRHPAPGRLFLVDGVALSLRSEVPESLAQVSIPTSSPRSVSPPFLPLPPLDNARILTHVCLVCDPAEDGRDNGNVHEADSGCSGGKSEVTVAGLLHRCASS